MSVIPHVNVVIILLLVTQNYEKQDTNILKNPNRVTKQLKGIFLTININVLEEN